MSETKTISLAGSNNLYWEDVDDYARKHGFTTTASFVQYALEKEILGFKTKLKDIINYVMLLAVMGMILLMLSLLLR